MNVSIGYFQLVMWLLLKAFNEFTVGLWTTLKKLLIGCKSSEQL